MIDSVLVHGVQDSPDKTTEFSDSGRDGDIAMFLVIEAPELFVETVLGLQGNGDDLGRLSLAATLEDQVGSCAVVVVPGGLDQEASYMDIAGLGDRFPLFPASGGVFRGTRPK